ncbi:MAG TPA: isoprenylcysteine carboxylmethyltransferase family protein [Spirochaetota bacterium]|nr:isoprenylcysteine carboxylmethyltransferase family protein [Spirochaetota bacterium]
MSFFDVFQLTMMGLFLLVFGGRTAIMSIRGTRVIVLGTGKSGFGAVLEVVFLAGLCAWCWEVVAQSLGHEARLLPETLYVPVIEHPALSIAGAVMIGAGFIVFIWALVSFGASWRVGIDTRRPGDLITHGAFSISRNPIFLFIDLYFVGTALIYGNPFFLTCALATVTGIHFQIKQEEKFLSKQYGGAYAEYLLRTRRYL